MKIVPKCRECGAKVWRVSSGLVCDECRAKIVPVAHVDAQSLLPLDWSEVETIKGRGRVKFNGRQPESLEQQNARLAEHGEFQNSLFLEV